MPRKTLHPTFQKKKVVDLSCRFCGNTVCDRGMKAILLADTAVELYSTDLPPPRVDLVETSYQTEKCNCKIKDVACLGCGNVVGYTVVQPCRHCLESCNNGHFWMFHSHSVESQDRVDYTGTKILSWGKLLEDESMRRSGELEEECFR